MDRAHRLGQKNVVNVYRLITSGTLEEKIMNVQRFKMNIANEIVNQQNAGLQSMGTDQLLDLFEISEEPIKVKTNTNSSGPPILQELGELYDDDQYNENIDSYMSKINN
eukprot:NODE_96_length_20709_cov_1.429161.p19 type:complete len:109 gc:universal NODE_96_length_20709_cov_1.429161:3234-3560(+)